MNIRATASRSKIGIFGLAIIAVSVLFIRGMTMVTARDEVTVSFRLAMDQVSLHEPIFVDFSVHNGLNEEIQFDLGKNRKTGFVFVIESANLGSRELSLPIEEGLGRIGRLSLAAHETYSQRLLLNEWHDFNQVDSYTVRGRLSTAIRTASGKKVSRGAVESADGPMIVQVQARDPERLKNVCEELARIAILPNAEKAGDATLALNYVKDPIAVPYLERVIDKGMLTREMAVTGLERIGDREAVEVLIRSLDKPYADMRSLVKFALSKIQDQTTDSAIKQRIRSVLVR